MKDLDGLIEFLENILTKLRDDSVHSNEEVAAEIYSMIEELQED